MIVFVYTVYTPACKCINVYMYGQMICSLYLATDLLLEELAVTSAVSASIDENRSGDPASKEVRTKPQKLQVYTIP